MQREVAEGKVLVNIWEISSCNKPHHSIKDTTHRGPETMHSRWMASRCPLYHIAVPLFNKAPNKARHLFPLDSVPQLPLSRVVDA